jgi:hypothetical protein
LKPDTRKREKKSSTRRVAAAQRLPEIIEAESSQASAASMLDFLRRFSLW